MSDLEIAELRRALEEMRRNVYTVNEDHRQAIARLQGWADAATAQLGDKADQSEIGVWREAVQRVHSYTSLILGLGYGGILAIWSQSAEVRALHPQSFILAGGLVLLSLLLFLATEVYSSWLMMKAIGGKQLTPENLKARDEAQDAAGAMGRFMFVPTVVTGFGGGLGMLACHVLSLIGRG
jgi:hypothetical protein